MGLESTKSFCSSRFCTQVKKVLSNTRLLFDRAQVSPRHTLLSFSLQILIQKHWFCAELQRYPSFWLLRYWPLFQRFLTFSQLSSSQESMPFYSKFIPWVNHAQPHVRKSQNSLTSFLPHSQPILHQECHQGMGLKAHQYLCSKPKW